MAISTKALQEKLSGNKYIKTSLKYPTDITTKGNQNIVLFNINVVSGSKFNKAENRQIQGGNEQIKIQQPGSNSLRSKLTTERGTVRIDTSIALYIPGGISASYNAEWSSVTLGSAGRLAKTAGNLDQMSWSKLGTAVKEGFINMTTGILQTLTPLNAKSLTEFTRGTIVNPYMEMTFTGIQNRQFQFQFKFTPRDEAEAIEVEKIVKAFKVHQAPENKYDAATSTSYWLYPSEFDITFLHRGEENEHVNKISTCVLTNVTINHDTEAGNFATFPGGYPVQTNMTLSFTEQEILTKERIEAGF